MPAQAPVPIVDISGLYLDDFEARAAVSAEIGKAIKEIGFLYIKGYDISKSTVEGVKEAASDFFKLSPEEKMKYYVGNFKSARGFVPEGEEVFEDGRPPDRKEAIAFGRELPDDHPLVKRNVPFHGQNPDVSTLPKFNERVKAYFDGVYNLAFKLIRAFALILGLNETDLDSYFEEPLATLRLLHYPFRADLEDVPGIGAHEDFECLTLLLCDAPGLELKVGENEWMDVLPVPDTLILNIGDMFEVLSNGRLKPKTHRVRAVKEERYSIPFFFGGNYFTEMKPLPQFTSPGDKPTESPVMGDHVWSAFLQIYRHLNEKVRSGELEIPKGTKRRGVFAEQPEAFSTTASN